MAHARVLPLHPHLRRLFLTLTYPHQLRAEEAADGDEGVHI